jgi:hypothetical protein
MRPLSPVKLFWTFMTVELAIRPVFPNYSGFRFLVLVHDGDDNCQFVIAQWRSSLVIMNSSDYSNRQWQSSLDRNNFGFVLLQS